MRKTTSIRRKLTSRLLVGLFLIYAVLGVSFYKIVEVALTDQFDKELVNWVNNISEMFDFEEPEMDNEFQGTVFDEDDVFGDRKYYQVWTNDKKTIAKSPSLNNSKLPFFDVDLNDYRFENIQLPHELNGRAVLFSFVNHRIDEDSIDETTSQKFEDFIKIMADNKTPDIETDKKNYYAFLKDHGIKETNTQLIISMAYSRVWLDKILLVIRLCLFGVGLILITGSWLIIRKAIKAGLLPLDDIAQKTAEINSNDLNQRFAEEKIPEELLPVIIKLNEMLERLEKSFSREKRFTANVAHELRTPIAELRALAEVGRMEDVQTSGDILSYFDDAFDIAIQMQNITESLLMLARIDSGSIIVSQESFCLEEMLNQIIKIFDNRKEGRLIELSIKGIDNILLISDKVLFESILTNLISNAVYYSPDNTTISVSLRLENKGLFISVSNKITDITNKDLDYMFEPFWRKDVARSDLSHSGIGLTIVKSSCKLLNISINTNIISSETIEVSLFIPEK